MALLSHKGGHRPGAHLHQACAAVNPQRMHIVPQAALEN